MKTTWLDGEYIRAVDAIRLLPDPDDYGDGTWSGWSKEIDRLEAKAGMIREEIARGRRDHERHLAEIQDHAAGRCGC